MRRDKGRLNNSLNNLEKLFPSKFGEKVGWESIREIILANARQKRKEYLIDYFWDYSIEELQDLVSLVEERVESKPSKKVTRRRGKAKSK